MRTLLFAVTFSVALPAVAQIQFPEPVDLVSRQLLERYRTESPGFAAADFLTMPATLPAWPCEVSEKDQYKLAGLIMAHPELKKDIAKQTRKQLRQMGIDANAVGEQKYSDIKFAPIVATCKDGKIDGEVQLLVSYKMQMENKSSFMMGEKQVGIMSTIESQNVNRVHFTAKAGERTGDSLMIAKIRSASKTTYDDPKMTSMMGGKMDVKPIDMVMVTYGTANGQMAMFNEIDSVKVTSGFLAPSIKTEKALSSTFIIALDDNRSELRGYTNKRLTTISHMKGGKPHGENITYMDNVYKTLGQRIDQIPGMENAREVMIDGVAMIEMRTCMQEGVRIKTSTCSNE